MAKVLTAQVALSDAIYAIDRPFDYRIPPSMTGQIMPGIRVMVPFGAGNRRTDGMVLGVHEIEEGEKPLKDILAALDDTPVLEEEAIRLAIWMHERYFCTVYDAVKAMLPTGLSFSLRDTWQLKKQVSWADAYEAAKGHKAAEQLLSMLAANGGSAERQTIRTAFGAKDPGPALRFLQEKGILELETSAMRGIGDKTEQIAVCAVPPEEAMQQVAARRKPAPLRYAVMELLVTVGSASVKELCYLTGASMATMKSLAKSGLIRLEKHEVLRQVIPEGVEPAGPVTLNEEQQRAFDGLNGLLREEKPAAALLYGVTGSGKTQVYIQLIKEVLRAGKSAIVLVPEIALTPQLLRIFSAHFGKKIALLHSSLRMGERYDEWKRLKKGDAMVAIGTRSAVFAPVKNLGLIVLDEEQEYTYKSENVPRYHAREVAKYRCVQNHALLLLGSATPSVESHALAEQGIYHSFTLRRRYNEQALPEVQIVDMKQELRQGNGTAVSELLRAELSYNLEHDEQSILFLNRRGANRMVSCGECGEVPTCPRCSVHLTYHSANHRLMCHYCGHSEPLPAQCPHCGGAFNFIGTGTQKLEAELQALFPDTKILRMDTDTVSAARSHEMILEEFRQKKAPILIGTQMVAKGLDFENVTLVGVADADLGLYTDDFRASERTFSLITQVVGRAGRGNKKGRAVIQTYTPENDVLLCASRQDYDSFYREEIEIRRLLGCPPFRDLFVLTASGTSECNVLQACVRLRQGLEACLRLPEYQGVDVNVLGPAPAAVAKVNNRFRYRLTVTGQNTRQLRGLIAHLLRAAHFDKQNKGVSVFADVNPFN